MKTKVFLFLFFIFLMFSSIVYALQEARVLRFPSIHNDQIVFTYAGDLYTVSSESLPVIMGLKFLPVFPLMEST